MIRPMRTALSSSLLAASLAASLLAGCGAGGPTDDGADQVGTPEDPVPAKTGPYQLVTTVDFTIEAILPPQIEEVVVTLRDFSTNPAHALLDLAERRGVVAVTILRAALPGFLEDKLEGWINGEIEKLKIAGKPITEYAGEIAMLAEIALTQFAVDSELAIDGTDATHRITGLDLRPAGIDFRLPIGGLAGDILTQAPSLSVADRGALSLGEQHFGLAYGEYAWQGIDAASTLVFGGGVRATLGKVIDCQAVAHAVASKCLLNVCVGHETELRQICTGGLDAVVDFAHDKLAAMRLDVLHFAQGTARLVDDDGDGVGDRIADGVWQAELNLGLGLRHAPASFTGTR
jgi:predicted small lipoprotein YifL